MSQTVYIAIGPYCWGRADTALSALKNAKRNLPRFITPIRNKAMFRVWKVHPDSYVNEMGGLSHPADHPPVDQGYYDHWLKAASPLEAK